MTKQELEHKHGTPEEFAEAVWLACDNLMITPMEAREAITNYWKEWEEAE